MDKLLAIDIGAGTQDIFLFQADQPVENCVKMVLPSPTTLVSQRICYATESGRDVWLTGTIMGGGPCVSAIKGHLRRGYRVFSTPKAALTINDDLSAVESLGIVITAEAPKHDHMMIELRDLDIITLQKALSHYLVELPTQVAVAVQDHGHCPSGSNRRFRFRHWEKFLFSGGRLDGLCYREIPDYLSRMRAVQETYGGAILMDTGAAAIWGVLTDPIVARHQDRGFIAVNVGNQHTLGIFLKEDRIWGLFEHHTRLLTSDKIVSLINNLALGNLTNEEVFQDGGHGASIHPDFRPSNGQPFVTVSGPQRQLLQNREFYWAAPCGDMMLAGCFGLAAACGLIPIGDVHPA